MTEDEFQALLCIEDKVMQVYRYTDKFWVGEILDKETGTNIKSAIGDTKPDAVFSLARAYYANRRK
jgi:hypothetical protein